MSDIRDYRVDHLLLLVGSNPLPGAVAGKLLTATGGKITLIYSHDSCALAQKLSSWFQRTTDYSDIELFEVKETDATSVYNCVSKVLKAYEKLEKSANRTGKTRVGLNYTTGTKVMSVQAYRALEDWTRSHHRDVIFSYLDAHTLQMCFDPAPGRDVISFYVGQGVDISIRGLLELHNWELKDQPIAEPVLLESAKALLAVHSSPTEAKVWTQWLRDELFLKARKRAALASPFWVFQSGKELQQPLRVEQPAPNNEWKSKTALQALAIPWPKNLPELCETMRTELKQDNTENLTLKDVSGCKNAEDFCKWCIEKLPQVAERPLLHESQGERSGEFGSRRALRIRCCCDAWIPAFRFCM